MNSETAAEGFEVDYRWIEMPSGPFVGEVYNLTHAVIKDLEIATPDNDTFIVTETNLRNYVWMAAQRAYQSGRAEAFEIIRSLKTEIFRQEGLVGISNDMAARAIDREAAARTRVVTLECEMQHARAAIQYVLDTEDCLNPSANNPAWDKLEDTLKILNGEKISIFNFEHIKKFVHDYINQSNAGTAWPYAYVVQQEVIYATPAGYGEMAYYWYEDEQMSRADIDQHNRDNPHGQIDIDQLERIGDLRREWQDVQWFFTSSAAEKYIDLDSHNLKNPRVYIKHFRRSVEAELLLRTMFTLAGEDYDHHRK